MAPSFRTALLRGLRRRCARCGEGRLFRYWVIANDRCSSCGLEFQPNQGDTWMFIVLTDRIPLGFGIAALFLGFRPHGFLMYSAFLALLAVPMVATMPHRTGVAIALNYLLSRRM